MQLLLDTTRVRTFKNKQSISSYTDGLFISRKRALPSTPRSSCREHLLYGDRTAILFILWLLGKCFWRNTIWLYKLFLL